MGKKPCFLKEEERLMVSVVFGMNYFSSGSSASSSAAASSTLPFDPNTPSAARSLDMLMTDPEMLKALAEGSFPTLPPSTRTAMSLLWALLNPRSDSAITEADVERAIRNLGGTAVDVTVFWSKLSPEGEDSINAGDFALNDFLAVGVPVEMAVIKDKIDETRQELALEKARGTSGSVLDMFAEIGFRIDV